MVTYTKILLYQLTDIISQAWLHTQISALECGDGRSIIRNWFLLASALFSTKWLKSKYEVVNSCQRWIFRTSNFKRPRQSVKKYNVTFQPRSPIHLSSLENERVNNSIET
jgi:hypothetical protein